MVGANLQVCVIFFFLLASFLWVAIISKICLFCLILKFAVCVTARDGVGSVHESASQKLGKESIKGGSTTHEYRVGQMMMKPFHICKPYQRQTSCLWLWCLLLFPFKCVSENARTGRYFGYFVSKIFLHWGSSFLPSKGGLNEYVVYIQFTLFLLHAFFLGCCILNEKWFSFTAKDLTGLLSQLILTDSFSPLPSRFLSETIVCLKSLHGI